MSSNALEDLRTLTTYTNGKYRINNVPCIEQNGETYWQGTILQRIAKTIVFMEKNRIYETDFESELFQQTDWSKNSLSDKDLKKIATFELNRYRAMLKESKNGDSDDIPEKVQLLENCVSKLDTRLQEVIRARFMRITDGKRIYDDLETMQNLNVSRSLYYSLKGDALQKIGQMIVEGAD